MDGPPQNKSKCCYKEKDRRLKDQFINSINDYDDNDMMTEIMRELTAIKNTSEITSKQMLCWP